MTKAETTKRLIVQKSAPLFNTKGIAGTAMSDVMEVTHMPKGSLYIHFENKEDLACAVVDYHLESLLSRIEKNVARHTTISGKLAASFEHLANPLNTSTEGGCPMINFGMEADDTNPIIRRKVNKTAEIIQANIAALVEEGKKKGEFKSNWNGASFALRSFSMVEGAIVLSRISVSRDKLNTILKLIKKEIKDNSK